MAASGGVWTKGGSPGPGGTQFVAKSVIRAVAKQRGVTTLQAKAAVSNGSPTVMGQVQGIVQQQAAQHAAKQLANAAFWKQVATPTRAQQLAPLKVTKLPGGGYSANNAISMPLGNGTHSIHTAGQRIAIVPSSHAAAAVHAANKAIVTQNPAYSNRSNVAQAAVQNLVTKIASNTHQQAVTAHQQKAAAAKIAVIHGTVPFGQPGGSTVLMPSTPGSAAKVGWAGAGGQHSTGFTVWHGPTNTQLATGLTQKQAHAAVALMQNMSAKSSTGQISQQLARQAVNGIVNASQAKANKARAASLAPNKIQSSPQPNGNVNLTVNNHKGLNAVVSAGAAHIYHKTQYLGTIPANQAKGALAYINKATTPGVNFQSPASALNSFGAKVGEVVTAKANAANLQRAANLRAGAAKVYGGAKRGFQAQNAHSTPNPLTGNHNIYTNQGQLVATVPAKQAAAFTSAASNLHAKGLNQTQMVVTLANMVNKAASVTAAKNAPAQPSNTAPVNANAARAAARRQAIAQAAKINGMSQAQYMNWMKARGITNHLAHANSVISAANNPTQQPQPGLASGYKAPTTAPAAPKAATSNFQPTSTNRAVAAQLHAGQGLSSTVFTPANAKAPRAGTLVGKNWIVAGANSAPGQYRIYNAQTGQAIKNLTSPNQTHLIAVARSLNKNVHSNVNPTSTAHAQQTLAKIQAVNAQKAAGTLPRTATATVAQKAAPVKATKATATPAVSSNKARAAQLQANKPQQTQIQLPNGVFVHGSKLGNHIVTGNSTNGFYIQNVKTGSVMATASSQKTAMAALSALHKAQQAAGNKALPVTQARQIATNIVNKATQANNAKAVAAAAASTPGGRGKTIAGLTDVNGKPDVGKRNPNPTAGDLKAAFANPHIMRAANGYSSYNPPLSNTYGDRLGHSIIRANGMEDKPTVVSTAEMDRLAKQYPDRVMYRGSGAQIHAQAFQTGDYFVGTSRVYGSGYYWAAAHENGRNYTADARQTATTYSKMSSSAGPGPAVLKGILRPDAKMIDNLVAKSEAHKWARQARKTATTQAEHDFIDALEHDPGLYAAHHGYDVLVVSKANNGYNHPSWVVLNRSAVIVQKDLIP